MRFLNKENGITLIALVVTIAVLLILAAVTIQFTLGDNGIVQQAKDAVNEQKNAINKDEATMNSLINELQQLREEMSSGETGEIESTGLTPDDRIEISKVSRQSYTQYAEDQYNNPITIPAGFTVAAHGTNHISYTYAGDAAHTPTVQDGIVMVDAEGNQFTWVPVGTINNKTGDTRGTTTTINLARIEWVFATGESGENKQEITTVAQANAVTNDNAVELKSWTTNTQTNRWTELVSKATGKGTAALNLNAFLESAIENRGYYIARFEAGVTNYDSENIATSQSGTEVESWTGYQAETGKTLKVVSKQGEQVWNYITQSKAAEVAQGMYTTNSNYVSDLANSFAWDTAIVFINTYGYTSESDDTKYAIVNVGPDDGRQLSGTSKTDTYDDNYCNIYDMSGNYSEWTTENTSNSNYPCTLRGGNNQGTSKANKTASRYLFGATSSEPTIGFRSILYIATTTE